MSFGSNLRAARKAKHMTQRELAAKINAAHNSISNWENNQNMPDTETIQNLCWALDVDPNYFFSAAVPGGFAPPPSTYKAPLVGNIACGTPVLAEENIETYVDVPDDIRCDFSLRCRGDSMIDAGIQDGDLAYIRAQPTVENGEIAAVRIGEEATLKRVYWENGQLTLVPANGKYPPKTYSGVALMDVHIEGKAVGFTHWF